MKLAKRLLVVPAVLLLSSAGNAAEPVDYQRDVFPILQSYCLGCHTSDAAEGGLVMESHADLMAGGDSGLAVTAGVPSSSRMMLMLMGQLEPVMPPEGEARPTEREVEILKAWVEQGAVGPDGDMPIKRELRTPKIETTADLSMPITAIAFSPTDGRRAIARYGVVEILDADQRVVAKLDRELNKVNSIQFSKDGERILVASGLTGAFGNAAIFSANTGELLAEFVGHRDVLYAATFSPDETLIATAGYDRDIILWDVESGEPIRNLTGHNGAIFDLAFSPDGEVLVSACADETVKVWHVATGNRLDTLSQPEGEVFATAITPDGRHILAGSGDNRLRVWELRSKRRPRINPIVATRFVDETPLVNFALTPDGRAAVVLSEAGNVKVIRTSDWNQAATLPPLGETGSDLSISPDGNTALISLMNGKIVTRRIPTIKGEAGASVDRIEPVYLDLGELTKTTESEAREATKSDPAASLGSGDFDLLAVPRGVEISGVISQGGEEDYYRWHARRGEVWAIDADAAEKSPIDPIVTVLDAENQPVLRTRLQAVRDSYFTFRGKDSLQIGDFRLFNWEEMHLNDYLYAAGEVTRLWLYPRGPDSGYNVYPNEGQRWTYFGTTHTTHALGEPAYIVEPLAAGQEPIANGLPVFDIHYENDDDPMRIAGNNSRLLFTAPSDATYTVRIADTRGDGGDGFGYRLSIRPANPSFAPSLAKANGTIRRGAGREFIVRVDRLDGFDGPVTFDIPDLPPQIASNVPVTIEPGQRFAIGTLWVAEDAEAWEGKLSPQVVARATINGRSVERQVGPVGELTLGDPPRAIPSIQPIDRTVAENEAWTLSLHRGETVSARVIIRRQEGFTDEVSFGKEGSGRNATHGVYVDNIGLNGLLVRQNETEREFFLTADPIAQPGKRAFFLRAEVDGNVTTHPIVVEVLP
jgi:WD40 repeat protein